MASPHDQPPGVQVGQDLLLDQDKASTKSQHNPEAVFNSPGISSSPSPCTVSASSTTSGPRFGSSGSSSRQKIYLLDQFPCTDISKVKLPKMISVMRCFFGHVLNQQDLNNNNNPLTLATKKAAWEAAKETAVSIKSVWRHHFGIRLIDGKETLTDDVDSTKIMIYGEKYVAEQIMAVFSEWKAVERLSRRPDRAALLLRKEDSFRNKLSIPFNILKPKGEDIL